MWIVVNIGCIECGVSSNIVGVFDNEERANAIAEEFDAKFDWREGGQISVTTPSENPHTPQPS